MGDRSTCPAASRWSPAPRKVSAGASPGCWPSTAPRSASPRVSWISSAHWSARSQMAAAGSRASRSTSPTRASIARAIDTVQDALGPIDVLINNAGVAVSKGVLEQTEADWDKVLDTNLKGAFFVAQAVAKRMVARDPKPAWGGNIVNIASVLALDVVGHLAPVRRVQGRPVAADQDHGARARPPRRPGQCARARLHRDRDQPRFPGDRRRASGCGSASRSAASARPRTSTARSCCSPRTRRAT